MSFFIFSKFALEIKLNFLFINIYKLILLIQNTFAQVLVTVGDDRRYCEYDLENSSMENGLLCLQKSNSEINENEIKNQKSADYRNKQNYDNTNNTSNTMRNAMTGTGSLTNFSMTQGRSPSKNALQILEKMKITNIEVEARPTAILWHPITNSNDTEDRFILANDEYKFKEFNADSKQCRKTTLAPVFSNFLNSNFENNFNNNNRIQSYGSNVALTHPSTTISSPLNFLIPITINGKVSHYGYSCSSRIIGLGSFPLTGDPSEVFNFFLFFCFFSNFYDNFLFEFFQNIFEV